MYTKADWDLEAEFLFGDLSFSEYQALQHGHRYRPETQKVNSRCCKPYVKPKFKVMYWDKQYGFRNIDFADEREAFAKFEELSDKGICTLIDCGNGSYQVDNDLRFDKNTHYLKSGRAMMKWTCELVFDGIRFVCVEDSLDHSLSFHDTTFGTWAVCNKHCD